MDAVAKQFALQQLHDDKVVRLKLLDPVDRADVRMIERRRGARFALESLEQVRIAGHGRCQEFQSDMAAEIDVFSFVDNAHSALAQLRGDPIMRDGSAYHE